MPLYAAEHFYLVTKAIPGVTPDMPVVRDPDGYLYFKEEVGGIVMGGFEPKAKPWNVDPIPDGFEFQLLPEDWDHFEILMKNAIHRTPCLETAEVKLLLNGPESFTLDGNFILGEAPELAGYFVCAGFNSAGIANAGGAGKLVAEWIVNGDAPLDLWDVDIRRFAPFHANRRHLADRTVETLGLHYAMRWPREELETVRPLRRSPLYDRLAAKRAVFGSKMNWERANYFLPPGAVKPPYTLGTPGWLPHVLEEQRACREDVVVFDQTSFSKFVLKGRAALAVLQRLCANEIDVPVGTDGLHGDAQRARRIRERPHDRARSARRVLHHHGLGADDARLRVDRARHPRRRACGAGRRHQRVLGALRDGPEGRGAARPLSPDDLSQGRHAVRRDPDDRRRVRARARRADELRRGPGYELYVPTDQCVTLYDALWSCGAEFGLKDAGYYTIDALRIEAGRRAWGAELSPDETPWEAGLGYAVKMDKPAAFVGRDALARSRPRASGSASSCSRSTIPPAFPWGGEPILMDGRNVGELTSTGYPAATGARSRWATRAPTARSPTMSCSARATGSTSPASSTP